MSSTANMSEGQMDVEELLDQSFIYSLPKESLEEHCYTDEKISLFKLLKESLKQLRPGMPIYRMVVPSILLSPISQLEKVVQGLEPNNLFFELNHPDKEKRFLNLLKWKLVNLKKFSRDGIKCSKPFNPIIGEIFRCKWGHKDSTTLFLAEQVCHHPPVTAYHQVNDELGFESYGSIEPQVSLHLNSITVKMKGRRYIKLKKYDETYSILIPGAQTDGVIFGSTTTIRQVGKGVIKCEKTGYTCNLNFEKEKFKGVIDYKGKVLYKVNGSVTDKCWITEEKTGNKEILYDVGKVTSEPISVNGIETHKENESRKVWHKVAYNIYKGDFKQANFEKYIIEERQRAKRRKRKFDNIEFIPKFFTKSEEEKQPEWIIDRKNFDEEMKEYVE